MSDPQPIEPVGYAAFEVTWTYGTRTHIAAVIARSVGEAEASWLRWFGPDRDALVTEIRRIGGERLLVDPALEIARAVDHDAQLRTARDAVERGIGIFQQNTGCRISDRGFSVSDLTTDIAHAVVFARDEA